LLAAPGGRGANVAPHYTIQNAYRHIGSEEISGAPSPRTQFGAGSMTRLHRAKLAIAWLDACGHRTDRLRRRLRKLSEPPEPAQAG